MMLQANTGIKNIQTGIKSHATTLLHRIENSPNTKKIL